MLRIRKALGNVTAALCPPTTWSLLRCHGSRALYLAFTYWITSTAYSNASRELDLNSTQPLRKSIVPLASPCLLLKSVTDKAIVHI